MADAPAECAEHGAYPCVMAPMRAVVSWACLNMGLQIRKISAERLRCIATDFAALQDLPGVGPGLGRSDGTRAAPGSARRRSPAPSLGPSLLGWRIRPIRRRRARHRPSRLCPTACRGLAPASRHTRLARRDGLPPSFCWRPQLRHICVEIAHDRRRIHRVEVARHSNNAKPMPMICAHRFCWRAPTRSWWGRRRLSLPSKATSKPEMATMAPRLFGYFA